MILHTQFNAQFNAYYYMRTSIDEEDGTIGLMFTHNVYPKDTQLSIDDIKCIEFNYESKEGIVEQEKNELLNGNKQEWYKSPFKYQKMRIL